MMYTSTRDSVVSVSAARAISQGISAEGGLFVPERLPVLTIPDIISLGDKPYAERAEQILSLFLTDFSQAEIRECTAAAYNTNTFYHADIAPVRGLNGGVHILELWHGPTCAFKDMALQILPHFMRISAEKTVGGKTIVILVATSGDTGKAALEGFKDAPNTKILVFYPEDGVSPMQKLQMVTQEGENVAVCAIRGNFDDAQNGVKAIFTDRKMAGLLEDNGMMFSSANSINWGRLVPQIVYYFSAYADLIKSGEAEAGKPINIVVPTGNFGNILAAYYAMQMGLPVSKLICASNKNKVLTDFINTGTYDRNREFFTTDSPSMDILISSNLERLLFALSDRDTGEINRLMESLRVSGKYTVSAEMHSRLRAVFEAGWCDDSTTAATINDVFKKYGYLCDTHTAVGIGVYEEYRKRTSDQTVTLIASTANPYKFAGSVLEAVGGDCSGADDFEKTARLTALTGSPVPEPLTGLNGKKRRFTEICNRTDMERVICDMLHIG